MVRADLKAIVREELAAGTKGIQAFARESITPAPFDDYLDRAIRFNPRRTPELLRRSPLHNLRRLPDGLWNWKWDPRLVTERLDSSAETAALWDAASRVLATTLVVRGAESVAFLDEDAQRLIAVIPTAERVTVSERDITCKATIPPVWSPSSSTSWPGISRSIDARPAARRGSSRAFVDDAYLLR